MALEITPVDATLGAVVRGVKLTALDDATWHAIYEAWLKYALLVFPAQHLTRPEQIAFAKRFGPLEYEMVPVSNVKPDGTIYSKEKDKDMVSVLETTHYWHADSTYQQLQAKGSVFCAEIIPEGGTQTGFADMRAAYDALSPAMRERVENLAGYHSYYRKQATRGNVISTDTGKHILELGGNRGAGLYEGDAPLRGLVKVHPETGRKSLLLGDHIFAIKGMPDDDAQQLLKELTEAACQPPRTYHHQWTVGDALLWDNRCLLHRSRPWNFAHKRVMWHTRIAGDPISEAGIA